MNHYCYEDLSEGSSEQFEVEVTDRMLEDFKKITGDVNPLHCDREFARARNYPDRVVYGMLTASFLSTLAGVWLPGENSLIHEVQTKFVKAVMIGDKLCVKGTVQEKNDLFRLLTVKVVITNQNGEKVLRGTMKVEVLDSDGTDQ